MKQESVNGRKNVQIGHALIDIYRDVGSHYRIRIRIRIFIVHKKASCDLWDEGIHLFLICVSFLKRGILDMLLIREREREREREGNFSVVCLKLKIIFME